MQRRNFKKNSFEQHVFYNKCNKFSVWKLVHTSACLSYALSACLYSYLHPLPPTQTYMHMHMHSHRHSLTTYWLQKYPLLSHSSDKATKAKALSLKQCPSKWITAFACHVAWKREVKYVSIMHISRHSSSTVQYVSLFIVHALFHRVSHGLFWSKYKRSVTHSLKICVIMFRLQ